MVSDGADVAVVGGCADDDDEEEEVAKFRFFPSLCEFMKDCGGGGCPSMDSVFFKITKEQ